LNAAAQVNIRGYIDSYKSGEIDGVPVLKFTDFCRSYDRRGVILVASQAFAEIIDSLDEAKVHNYINAQPFVADLLGLFNKSVDPGGNVIAETIADLTDLLEVQRRIATLCPADELEDGDAWRRLFRDAMADGGNPAMLNEVLNKYEIRRGCDRLYSFPPNVSLCMTTTCNARCSFCVYDPADSRYNLGDAISIEQLSRMDWLKYVKTFAIWGGLGDSLIAPDFLKCFRWLRETHPHIKIGLTTNGQTLTREICEAFAEGLYEFNVSLNAATRETRERLMRTRHFEHICEMYRYLADLKQRRRSATPRMLISMVVTRGNMHEAPAFVDLAKSLGAEQVTFAPYITLALDGKRELDPTESPYFDRENADLFFDAAEARGEKLGMAVIRPLPFRHKDPNISFGTRSLTKSDDLCSTPWTMCSLGVDQDGRRQMIFCCSGFNYEIYYDKNNLATDGFMEIWNGPVARFFRRTARGVGINPVCSYCKTIDRFDPDNKLAYDIWEKLRPILEDIHSRDKSSGISDPDVDAAFLALRAVCPREPGEMDRG